jgi:hypothetical protein
MSGVNGNVIMSGCGGDNLTMKKEAFRLGDARDSNAHPMMFYF